MGDYYSQHLAAERLKRCYDIAPARIQQYLKAELDFVVRHTKPRDTVLDLGCGYGRTLESLTTNSDHVIGLDSSLSSLLMARQVLSKTERVSLICADAEKLPFADHQFDLVSCIQNGISAFHIDPTVLLNESIRVTEPGGIILFSTYSENIWNDRLEWFERQSAEGLLGAIDYEKTGNGDIVCRDGFTATTFDETRFLELTNMTEADIEIVEIDKSSLFCVIRL